MQLLVELEFYQDGNIIFSNSHPVHWLLATHTGPENLFL